ncbi:hypothetical protein E2P81_ATG00578 [Venturia nashicola]|nr:hypothetical protein E2P81_ATG00578 [Venturia nashicola]
MQFSTLLALFSAAALTSASSAQPSVAPSHVPRAVVAETKDKNVFEARAGPAFILVCCNPKNNDKYHMKPTGECCYNVGGTANYEFVDASCGMGYVVGRFSDCCKAKGKEVGTPDWQACTPGARKSG